MVKVTGMRGAFGLTHPFYIHYVHGNEGNETTGQSSASGLTTYSRFGRRPTRSADCVRLSLPRDDRFARVAGHVRRGDDVRQGEQRVIGKRGSRSNVSIPAPASFPAASAAVKRRLVD